MQSYPWSRVPLASSVLAVASVLLVVGVALGGGGTTTVEGGAYFDYVAPDPLGPTDGTIRFGFSGTVETIAADAVLTPPADTNLAFFGGGTPTCLGVAREGGVIISLEFVDECTVGGTVVRVDDLFGPDGDAYLIADRVAAPAAFVEESPTFATMIGVPAATGTTLDLTFLVDLTTGIPSSFIGRTSASGAVALLPGGDIGVGPATLPNDVIDAASRGQLEDAAAFGVDATVVIVALGTFGPDGEPTIEIELTVTYTEPTPMPTPIPTAAPSADVLPDTSTAASTGTPALAGFLGIVLIGTAWAGLELVAQRRRIG